MAQQTSIHFQPVKGGSEEHNKREKTLGYVHRELSEGNEYWESDTQEKRLAELKSLYKAKTGQKMQSKATPIREAVVVIDDKTSLEGLKRLAGALKQRWGIDVFQIAIHRDEGYLRGKNGKLNLHAHLVADWTNHETGRSLKLTRDDMAEMQTLCAEVLEMERGKSSDRKRLSAIQYKVEAQAKTAEELERRNAELQANIVRQEQRTGIKAAVQSLWGGGEKSAAKQAIKEAEEEKAKAKAATKRAEAERETLRRQRQTASERWQGEMAKAKESGRKAAVKEALAAANLHFNGTDNENVTPEQIGKAWRANFDKAETAKAEMQTMKTENGKELEKIKADAKRIYPLDAIIDFDLWHCPIHCKFERVETAYNPNENIITIQRREKFANPLLFYVELVAAMAQSTTAKYLRPLVRNAEDGVKFVAEVVGEVAEMLRKDWEGIAPLDFSEMTRRTEKWRDKWEEAHPRPTPQAETPRQAAKEEQEEQEEAHTRRRGMGR